MVELSGENTRIKFAPCTICSEPGCSTSKQITTITIKVITVVIRNEDGDSITNSFVETDVSPVVTTIEASDPSQIEVETTEYPQQRGGGVENVINTPIVITEPDYKFRYYNSLADKKLAKYPQINKLEQTTGVSKTYLAAGVLGIVSILIFFNFWGELLSNLIGWLYPVYASFKAIESVEKTDDTQWLTYW
ncbi:7366_t:CDS:2 [Entrophospora sp. SA101]|nr:7366_t:CDS:2 [Entrophospora sp. SA101]